MTSACEGKQVYTYDLALELARRARRRNKGCTVAPYKCDTCGGWHLGNSR